MVRVSGLCSVIIPSYNAGEFVVQSVASALAQTYPNIEVIVIDDGSTDDTESKLAHFRDRITYIHQPNRGLSAARNRGLEVARGEFVGLLDADDYWAPERLERLIAFLRANADVGFVSSDAYIVRGIDPTTETYFRSFAKLPKRWRSNQARHMLQGNFFFVAAVIRRALFDRHGNFDETLRDREDWDLWIRFLTQGERLDIVLEPLAYYRRRPGALSETRLDELGGKKAAFLEHVMRRPEVRAFPGAAGTATFVRGVESLVLGDGRSAREHFLRALDDPNLPFSRRLKARIGAAIPWTAPWLFRARQKLRRLVRF